MVSTSSFNAPPQDLVALTGEITAAYLRGNSLPAAAIPGVISTVFGSLLRLVQPEPQEEPLRPAVPIRRSVTAEYIVCLEDGRKLKMLKRHLRTTYDMTEPPRDCRRLQLLRDWSHDEEGIDEIRT